MAVSDAVECRGLVNFPPVAVLLHMTFVLSAGGLRMSTAVHELHVERGWKGSWQRVKTLPVP